MGIYKNLCFNIMNIFLQSSFLYIKVVLESYFCFKYQIVKSMCCLLDSKTDDFFQFSFFGNLHLLVTELWKVIFTKCIKIK